MALILFGGYMVRYPLAGNLSAYLQWLHGFRRLGHDVYLVERSTGWDCYDPSRTMVSDDGSYGIATVSSLLARFELEGRWVFRDVNDVYYGLSRQATETLFRMADLYIDIGCFGSWADLSSRAARQVVVDLDPAYAQIRWANGTSRGVPPPHYDAYFTVGMNVGTDTCTAPSCGLPWNTVFNPVSLDLYPYCSPPAAGCPLTTVMNWRAHKPVEYDGRLYGQKDVEFLKFLDLPSRVSVPVEVAVSGREVPHLTLSGAGWRIRDAEVTTRSFDSYQQYIRESLAEFSVCKQVFAATRSGWFSDRTGAYLASGRPAIVQETGVSAHLPCGEGLITVNTVEEAAEAVTSVAGNVLRHSRRAREIAAEYLDASRVLPRFLDLAMQCQPVSRPS